MENHFFIIRQEDLANKKIFGYDCENTGNVWHRAKVFADFQENDECRIFFYTSDSQENFCDDFFKESFLNPADINLHKYRGRFLWVKLDGAQAANFFEMKIYYLAQTFADYLPAVYQDNNYNSFFIRFMAIFQNIYLDMDETIAKIPQLLEPMTTAKSNLALLAKWINCVEFDLLPEEKRPSFILNCLNFYQSLGTRFGLEQALKWLCGQKPGIIEYFEYKKHSREYAYLKEYCSLETFEFTLLLTRRGIDAGIRGCLMPFISKIKPAYTSCNLILLNDIIWLDKLTYLGVNSTVTSGIIHFPRDIYLGINSFIISKDFILLDACTYAGVNSIIRNIPDNAKY